MKSIKNQLFITILSVVILFGILIFAVTITQFIRQKNTIQKQGMGGAQVLSEETGKTLEQLNEQTARDFAGTCSRYFNTRFATIRKQVNSLQKYTAALYQEGKSVGDMDENVGLVKGVSRQDVAREFGIISPVRDLIHYLPEYNAQKIDRLDLYVMTESGMCLDGTQTPMGNHYSDLRKENWYRQAAQLEQSDKPYWSGVFTGKVSKKTKVICAMPIRDQTGRFYGCAAGDMEVNAFQDMVEEYDEEQIISVIFFDKNKELMHDTNDYGDVERARQYIGSGDVVNLGDEIYAFTELQETGWTICLVLDQTAVSQTTDGLQTDIRENVEGMTEIIQRSIGRTIGIFGISMAVGVLLSILISNFLAGSFVRPIRQLMGQVQEVGTGNLDQVVTVSAKNEIGELAEAFQHMKTELRDYMDHLQSMTASQERMAAECNVAKQIQRNMLPGQFPAFPEQSEFDVYGVANPVDTGGGSFYDFFMADKLQFCMVMGEVAGTGIPATLFAVITKTHIKNYAQLGYEPERILAETNNQLSVANEADLTVSVCVGIVNLQTGDFRYCNAGQMGQLWKHSGKDFGCLSSKSCFSLANMENVPYRGQSVHFAQGDMLFWYTPGVSETTDAKGNEYTQEYLQEHLNLVVRRQYELQEIADQILEDLDQFSDGMPQKKDSTLLLFRYFGR